MNIKFTKARIIKLFTIFLLILNLVVAVIIFSDIQLIKAPKTEVFVNILEVTSEEIILETTIKMSNPNNFEVSFEELILKTSTKDDKKIGEIIFDEGKIPSYNTKTFYSKDKIFFQEEGDFSIIKNKITGKIGVSFLGFIKKTIPLEVSVIASVKEIIDSLDIPDINMELGFENITQEGIEFTVNVELFNPTKIEFGIDEFSIIAKTEEDIEVGRLVIYGDIVGPEEYAIFTSKGSLNYNAFDSEKIKFTINGIARGKIGGLEKKVNISTDTELIIPDISEFIFKNQPIEFQIPVQFKLRLKGIVSMISFKIYNPSQIPLEGRDLYCCIFRVDGNEKTLLGEAEMDPCIIAPKERICVNTEIVIPYRTFLFSGSFKLLPDWIVLNINGHFSIAGTRQEFPISLNAYVDPTLFRYKEQV
jgi:LEA14-like dessication related protein